VLVPPRTARTSVASVASVASAASMSPVSSTPTPAPGLGSVVSQMQQRRPLGGNIQGAMQNMLSGRRTFGGSPGVSPGPLRANFAMRPPQADMSQPRPRPLKMPGPLA
jgi:hypothetical protein